MRRMQVAEDILPIGEFKARASELIRGLRATGRPLVVTQNGRPAAVVVTPEDFDRLNEAVRFIRAVERGRADADAGRLIDDDEMERQLDAEFAPILAGA